MKNNFIALEDYKKPDFNKLIKIFTKKDYFPIYIIRNYLDEKYCEELKSGFYNIIKKTNGGNRQNDFVPVLQVGSTQFEKSTLEYFKQCEETQDFIREISNAISCNDVKENFLLDKSLKKITKPLNINYRPSSFKGKKVNLFTARKWTNNFKNSLTLLPHEDLSQLKLAKIDGYEISLVNKVIASNLCISNFEGGEFLIWDYEPTEETKKKLNVENSGYPYPLELLRNKKQLSVKINTGDLYFINANLVHAVKEVKNSERITLGRFMGLNANNEIIYWT